MERRLALILVADIVGYSRLMEADEAGTFRRVKGHLAECVEPLIQSHSGRIVKHMGDGLLAEFASVVDGVRAAVEIQKAMAARELVVDPATQIAYRIGINLGDVIVENGDLFGDGVNVAARLEQLAEPGGICISGAAYDQMKGNVPVQYEPLGKTTVKNISEPVRAYRVIIDGLVRVPAAPKRKIWGIFVAATAIVLAAAIGAFIWFQGRGDEQPSNLRIAVLPFASDARDPARRYFADGIAEDVTTELSRIDGVTIAGQSVAAQLKEAGAARQEAATALGVDRLLEGSVRRAGDHVRITVKLTHAQTDGQIWTERFDRELQDVFVVQDEIADLVAKEVAGVIGGVAPLMPRVHTPNVDAYDAYVYGRARRIPPTPKNLAEALGSFERAISIDPLFAGGYSGVAYIHLLRYESPSTSDADAQGLLEKAAALAEKAVALDADFGPAWAALADVRFRRRDFDGALLAIRKAVDLAPSDSLMRASYGRLLSYAGEPDLGANEVKAAMRMSPDSLPMLFFLGGALRAAEKFEDAIAALTEHRKRLGGRLLPAPTAQLIATYIQAGQSDAGKRLAAELLQAYPNYTIAVANRHAFLDAAEQAAFLDALRQAGVPG